MTKNKKKWYIFVVVTMDWYTIYNRVAVVKAHNAHEAGSKLELSDHESVETWFSTSSKPEREME